MDAHTELRAFLDSPSKPKGVLSYFETHGFLFTVAAAPDLVPPSEWLPLVLGDERPVSIDEAQAERILGGLMNLYNDLVEHVTTGAVRLPEHCKFHDDVLANLEDDAPVSQWSKGFRLGHCWLEESWPTEGVTELNEELGACMMTLSFFSSRELALGFVRECAVGKQSLAELAEQCRTVFPDAMVTYALLGEACRRALRQTAQGTHRVERVGRNEPCPCGSGKKYKKCCLATAHVHGPDCDHGPHHS